MEKRHIPVALSQKIYGTVVFISAYSTAAAVVVMTLLVFIGVAARYGFGMALPFIDEYSGYLLVIIVFIGLSYTLKEKQHIRVDVLVERFPKRVSSLIEIINYVIGLSYVVTLAAAITWMVIGSFKVGAHSTSLMDTPLGPVQLAMPIGLTLIFIVLLIEGIQNIRALSNKK